MTDGKTSCDGCGKATPGDGLTSCLTTLFEDGEVGVPGFRGCLDGAFFCAGCLNKFGLCRRCAAGIPEETQLKIHEDGRCRG